MARRFERYRVKDGTTEMGQGHFNPVFEDVDLRLHNLELVEADWEQETIRLVEQGLKRIDEFLAPTIGKIQDLTTLGFLWVTSSTPLTFELGEKGVVVDEGPKRDLFIPTPWLSITRTATPDDWALAKQIDYDNNTGGLLFEIVSVGGDPGPHTDLVITDTPGPVIFYAELAQRIDDASAAAASAAVDAAAAAASAMDAANAVGAAQGHADDAQTHATAADTSRGQASGFADTAQTHANTASGHADNAAASAATAGSAAAAAVADRPTFEETYFLAVTL